MNNWHLGKIGRRLWAAFLAAMLVGIILAPSLRAQDATNHPSGRREPNIIFILADDLGYGDLGCYGQNEIKTPNIDKLAEEGMRFTSFYAGSTVCAPSRCALMTGKHNGHSRIRGNGEIPLSPEDVTVAEVLKKAGYQTAAIGKWGLGERNSTGVPGKKGFDQWFGYLNQVDAHNYYPLFLNRSDPRHGDRQVQLPENEGGQKGRYSDDFFTDAALNVIRLDQPKWYTKYQPFFLYLAYTIPHANDELGTATGNGMEVPSDAPYSGESWPQVEKNKAAMITRLDTDVGLILEKIQKLKMDNTVVIFSSDNGTHKEGGVDPKFFKSAGLLRGIKRDLYEGGIRVPFIVWWPGRVKPGTTSDLPAAFWDFLPTAADIADAKAPQDIDGISFLPTLLGQKQTNWHEFLYWEFHEDGFNQAVRMGDWKAVRFGVDGPLQLFNLKDDIGEKKNVAAEHPEIVAKIEDYLKTARTEDSNWPVKTAAESSKKEYGK
ncbi:MAG TPA: arylsulfatase [Verrucomicrobiae bacterium]|nr:arylsulfatase [Verrucomicrobiae bacterium]